VQALVDSGHADELVVHHRLGDFSGTTGCSAAWRRGVAAGWFRPFFADRLSSVEVQVAEVLFAEVDSQVYARVERRYGTRELGVCVPRAWCRSLGLACVAVSGSCRCEKVRQPGHWRIRAAFGWLPYREGWCGTKFSNSWHVQFP
jgi:hypothetical protein